MPPSSREKSGLFQRCLFWSTSIHPSCLTFVAIADPLWVWPRGRISILVRKSECGEKGTGNAESRHHHHPSGKGKWPSGEEGNKRTRRKPPQVNPAGRRSAQHSEIVKKRPPQETERRNREYIIYIQTKRNMRNNGHMYLPGGDAECPTGNGIMGRTGQCGPFGSLFHHFLCNILRPHPIDFLQSTQNGRARNDLRRRRRRRRHAAARAVVVSGGVCLGTGRGLWDRRQPRLLAHQRSHGGALPDPMRER